MRRPRRTIMKVLLNFIKDFQNKNKKNRIVFKKVPNLSAKEKRLEVEHYK